MDALCLILLLVLVFMPDTLVRTSRSKRKSKSERNLLRFLKLRYLAAPLLSLK